MSKSGAVCCRKVPFKVRKAVCCFSGWMMMMPLLLPLSKKSMPVCSSSQGSRPRKSTEIQTTLRYSLKHPQEPPTKTTGEGGRERG